MLWDKVEIIFFGGAGEIGGAYCVGLRYKDFKILIDCGIGAKQDNTNYHDWNVIREFAPDYALVTHYHLDHIGAVAALIHNKIIPRKIYMSRESSVFLPVQGDDTIKIAAREYFNKIEKTPRQLFEEYAGIERRPEDKLMPIDWKFLINASMDKGLELPFTYDDIEGVQYMTEHAIPGQVLTLGPAKVYPFYAGHIMGALSYVVEIGGKRIFFSGDFSSEATNYDIIKKINPVKIGRVDAGIFNATYAGEELRPFKSEQQKLIESSKRNMENGIVEISPQFYIDRASKTGLTLLNAGLGEYLWFDGKTRTGIDLYSQFDDRVKPLKKQFIRDDWDRAAWIRERIRDKIPTILIVSSGMGVVGSLSNNYLGEGLAHDNVSIKIVGYSEPGTPVNDLIAASNGGRIVNWRGRDIALKCKIEEFQFSAHATGDEIVSLNKDLRPKISLYTHCEPERTQRFLNEQTGMPGKQIVAENYGQNGKIYKI